MGPSISPCEGQSNTCINKNTRTCTQMLSHSCCGGGHTHPHGSYLFFSSGLNTSENVLTPWQHMLAQQYYGAWLSFNVSGDSRLNTQSHTWSPMATACVKDVTELSRLGLSWLPSVCLCMCASNLLYLCARSLFHHHGRRGESYKKCRCEPLRRDKGRLWPFTALLKLPCLRSPSLTPLLLHQLTNCYVKSNIVATTCQYLIHSLTQSPISFHSHTRTHSHLLLKETIFSPLLPTTSFFKQ